MSGIWIERFLHFQNDVLKRTRSIRLSVLKLRVRLRCLETADFRYSFLIILLSVSTFVEQLTPFITVLCIVYFFDFNYLCIVKIYDTN